VLKIFNGAGYYDVQNLNKNTKAGNKEWSVIVDSLNYEDRAAITRLENDLAAVQQQMKWLSTATVVPFVRNCASQILHFLVGDQPMMSTPTNSKFAGIVPGDSKYKLLEVVASDPEFGLSKNRLIALCDPLVTRRNNTVHCATVSQLNEVVKQAVSAFEAFPSLVLECRDEFDVISNYAVFRVHYPLTTPV